MNRLRPDFPTTMWTLLRQSRRREGEAFRTIVESYRWPIISYLLHKGLPEADAEDLAQEIFLRMAQKDFLDRAEASKGRFRNLILAVTGHALIDHRRRQGAWKRGGDAVRQSLDKASVEEGSMHDIIAATPPDEEFDRLWVWNLIQQAIDRLRSDGEESGRRYFEALSLLLDEHASQEEAARRMKLPLKDFYTLLQSARRRLRKILRDRVAAYASSTEEYDAELQIVTRYLG